MFPNFTSSKLMAAHPVNSYRAKSFFQGLKYQFFDTVTQTTAFGQH